MPEIGELSKNSKLYVEKLDDFSNNFCLTNDCVYAGRMPMIIMHIPRGFSGAL